MSKKKNKKQGYVVGNCYVVDQFRNDGLFGKLLDKAIKGIDDLIIITTMNKAVSAAAVKRGFVEFRKRGRFTEYRRCRNE